MISPSINFLIVQMQIGSSDSGLFAAAFATSLCCGFNPAQVQHTHRFFFPEPSYAMLQNKSMTLFPLCRKVIYNCNHKARNNHNSLHRPAGKYLMAEWFSVVFARFGIVSAFQGTYGKIAV